MNISNEKAKLFNTRFKFSQSLKSQMTKIKANTGIENWHTVCRWALCYSLSLDNEPPEQRFQNDSNLEITWPTIAGDNAEPIADLILFRYGNLPGQKNASLENYVKCHIARGLNLASKSVKDGCFVFPKVSYDLD